MNATPESLHADLLRDIENVVARHKAIPPPFRSDFHPRVGYAQCGNI